MHSLKLTDFSAGDSAAAQVVLPRVLSAPKFASGSKPRFRLSPSSLNLFEDCGRCFWLDLVKGVPRPQGIFPSLPSGVDRVLKEHFDSFMRRGLLPPELGREGLDGCKLFSDEPLLAEWRNNFRGIKYFDGDSGVMLRGAVDNLMTNGEKLVVLDFKTRGYPLKEDTAHHYQDQMNCYNFLLRKNGFATEDYAYLLFYMPGKIMENGHFEFTTQLVKMPTDVSHAENLFRKAIATLDGAMPAAGDECEYCAWVGKLNGKDD